MAPQRLSSGSPAALQRLSSGSPAALRRLSGGSPEALRSSLEPSGANSGSLTERDNQLRPAMAVTARLRLQPGRVSN
eukprot:4235371-Alexandrium_andersonii.AAC.1